MDMLIHSQTEVNEKRAIIRFEHFFLNQLIFFFRFSNIQLTHQKIRQVDRDFGNANGPKHHKRRKSK